MAAEFSIIMLCSKAALVIAGLGSALLFLTGAVNSRVEDEYWDRFWAETPIACLGSSVSAQDETVDFPAELRLAA